MKASNKCINLKHVRNKYCRVYLFKGISIFVNDPKTVHISVQRVRVGLPFMSVDIYFRLSTLGFGFCTTTVRIYCMVF